MNNMGLKKRRWERWHAYLLYCTKLCGKGNHQGTAGMKRYYNQRLKFHNRRIERSNEIMFEQLGEWTGIPTDQLRAQILELR